MSEALALSREEMSAGQLVLLNLDSLPERPDIIEAIQAMPVRPVGEKPKHRHTGERFFAKMAAHPEDAERVWLGLRLGLSVNLLAWRWGVSPNTLAAARQLMTERGELEAVRTRIDRLLDQVGEEGLEYWLAGMRSGVIHPGQIPIPVLAALTNKGQREAGIVPGTQRTGEEIERDAVLAELEVRFIRRLAADAASSPHAPFQAQNSSVVDVDTVPDTCPAPSDPPSAALGGPSARPSAGLLEPSAGDGGGGGAVRAGQPE